LHPDLGVYCLERATGIEPASSAWEPPGFSPISALNWGFRSCLGPLIDPCSPWLIARKLPNRVTWNGQAVAGVADGLVGAVLAVFGGWRGCLGYPLFRCCGWCLRWWYGVAGTGSGWVAGCSGCLKCRYRCRYVHPLRALWMVGAWFGVVERGWERIGSGVCLGRFSLGFGGLGGVLWGPLHPLPVGVGAGQVWSG